MGSAASRARGVPDPTEGPGPGPDQNWDALERLKHSPGALWTDEMASTVEHNLRHNWDLAPRPDENRCKWNIRVDATYDYYYEVMVQWPTKPLQAAQGPGQGQREHNPSNSEKPKRALAPAPGTSGGPPRRRLGIPERGPGVVQPIGPAMGD